MRNADCLAQLAEQQAKHEEKSEAMRVEYVTAIMRYETRVRDLEVAVKKVQADVAVLQARQAKP